MTYWASEASLTNPDLAWDHCTGRDKDGDKFSHHVLSHIPTARIVAKVYGPCEGSEYEYTLNFFYGSGYQGRKLDRGPGEMRFMSVEGAKAFVESVVERTGLGGWGG